MAISRLLLSPRLSGRTPGAPRATLGLPGAPWGPGGVNFGPWGPDLGPRGKRKMLRALKRAQHFSRFPPRAQGGPMGPHGGPMGGPWALAQGPRGKRKMLRALKRAQHFSRFPPQGPMGGPWAPHGPRLIPTNYSTSWLLGGQQIYEPAHMLLNF